MLQLDKKTVSEFENAWVQRLKVFFIEAGCSGTKIDMQTEFEIDDDLILLQHTSFPTPLLPGEGTNSNLKNAVSSPLAGENWERCLEGEWYSFKLYIPKSDFKHLENAKITRVIKADHTGVEQVRYIFASEDIEDRCGCGTSFAFEKPVPKIDLEKLKYMRENFFKNKK